MNYTLPSLTYAYDALEPFFDKRTMEIHHTKHHQTYIDNTNKILDSSKFKDLPINELLSKLHQIPTNIRTILRNNAGGHANHSHFWKGLKIGTKLKGQLKLTIENNFEEIKKFQEEFEKIAINHFGSGWVWLVLQEKENSKLKIVSTANQDNPLMGKEISGVSGYPILGLDLWEHAYYLKYQNRRLDYIKAFWNVVNWDEVALRLNSIKVS